MPVVYHAVGVRRLGFCFLPQLPPALNTKPYRLHAVSWMYLCFWTIHRPSCSTAYAFQNIHSRLSLQPRLFSTYQSSSSALYLSAFGDASSILPSVSEGSPPRHHHFGSSTSAEHNGNGIGKSVVLGSRHYWTLLEPIYLMCEFP